MGEILKDLSDRLVLEIVCSRLSEGMDSVLRS
jgi:hypothetical protein